MKNSRRLPFVASTIIPLLFSVSIAQADPFNGAIYTSTAGGATVNQNLYSDKSDVYLNGGPQNLNAAGLPDGVYYFQVTNPSGATLLSTDSASCRQLIVSNGVVAGATGACRHANGTTSANGSVPVQLFPFADTPNGGGEYKVWLIRINSQTSIDPNDDRIINFRDSKTDNFKVGPPARSAPAAYSLSGLKFYDANADGQYQNQTELPVANVIINVQVTCDGTPASFSATTDASGNWLQAQLPAGCEYSAVEELPQTGVAGSYWAQTAPAPNANGVRGYSGILDQDVTGLLFGNVCFVPASGGLTLGFWSNKNGQKIINQDLAGTLAFLTALPLKRPDGSDFNPASYTDFRNWLLSANAVNMANMLSVQLAATALDVRNGFLNPATIVDASSLGLGYLTIQQLIDAAKADLTMTSPDGARTFTGNPLRADEEIVKNGLDGVNNNRLAFAAPAGTCAVVYPVPQI